METDFNRSGLVGLLPRKTGPREAHKLTEEVIRFIKHQRLEERGTWSEVACAVEKTFGYRLHIRTMQKMLRTQEKKQNR